jgi:hypothetical protein
MKDKRINLLTALISLPLRLRGSLVQRTIVRCSMRSLAHVSRQGRDKISYLFWITESHPFRKRFAPSNAYQAFGLANAKLHSLILFGCALLLKAIKPGNKINVVVLPLVDILSDINQKRQ